MNFHLLPNWLDRLTVMHLTGARTSDAERWLRTLNDEGLLAYQGLHLYGKARAELIRAAFVARFPDVPVQPHR